METEAKENTKKLQISPLKATVELVKRGRREMLPRLRELLAAEPAVFNYVGDLGRQAQQAWADLVAGPDDFLRESLILRAEEMKITLAGHNATPLEKVAAERVVGAWMETEYLRQWRAQHSEGKGTKVGEYHEKRFTEADRRLEKALTSLATIKKLLPRTIQVQFQPPLATPMVKPVIAGPVYGDQPDHGNINTMATKEASVNGRSHLNGQNRITTPYDRLNDLLEPVMAK
jgi:hypothetical protein